MKEAVRRFAFQWSAIALLIVGCSASQLWADAAAFDLAGPKVDVHVERKGRTLPASQVPNLQTGDRVWIHPDLPESQSVRYLMIVAFLRGATNPPPESWFTRVDTWSKQVHDEGVFITVPPEAEEALIFLAPDTGGGYPTLRKAVRGKPGAFVRAAQDLWQASLDRSRLEKYLSAIKDLSTADPAAFKEHTQFLARSLNIKVDSQCFDKPTAQQVPCLTQGTDQLVLDDAHTESMVATIASGATGDLMSQISYTPQAKFGYYSPYVGAVMDLARILGTAHTAQYQYIPALALPKQDTLNLRLNNPPSFRNPKSVIVVGLPPIKNAVPPPPLRALDAKQVYCLGDPNLVLSVEGAPLIFATDLARDLSLRVEIPEGKTTEIPVHADARRGGLVPAKDPREGTNFEGELTATLHGNWGFQSFEGPHFSFRSPRSAKLVIASKDASALIIGREDTLHLQMDDSVCVKDIVVRDQKSTKLTSSWKKSKPDELEVHIPLKDAAPGTLELAVSKHGLHDPDVIALHTYAEAGRLDSFSFHSGDAEGTLKGTRLDQVASLDIKGIKFLPKTLSRANQQDELKMATLNGVSVGANSGESFTAKAELNDGRSLDVKAHVDAPRPQVTLMNKTVQPEPEGTSLALHFDNPGDLPQSAKLNFVLKAQTPVQFSADEKIEVATSDETFHVTLTASDGNLTLQDSKTMVAELDPMKHLGPSAFGAIKFRAIDGNGVQGDWQPLVQLVRVPQLKGIHCAVATDKQCNLVGDRLFLLDSVSVEEDFTNPIAVPDGFLANSLLIPRPKARILYVKLRDNPTDIDSVTLPPLAAE